jgi:uncharacterized membrane protein
MCVMVLRVAIVLISLLYPFAIYLGLRHFDARSLVLLLVAVAGLRILTDKHSALNHWLWVPLVGLLVFWILLSNSAIGLKLYPLFMNLSFFTMFAWSLRHPPTVIERLARLQYREFPKMAVRYTTKVTQIWCAFFVFNGTISLATALWGSDEVWALYNGLIAYLLIGILFAGEWLVRQRVLRLANG